MIYKAIQVTHIRQNEYGKSIWLQTFALRLEDLICFSIETSNESNKLES